MPDTAQHTEHSSPPSSGRTDGGAVRRWIPQALAAVVLAAALVLAFTLFVPTDDAADGPASTAPSVPAEEPVDESTRLSWAPPELDNPETIEVTEEDTSLRLDDDRDYRVVLPEEGLVSDGGLVLAGGRNVVLIGGRIEAEERALYLVDQTGTVHIEGVSLGGEGLLEGINLDQREGATVQLQNITVDMVTGEEDANHADLLQTWAGPRRLLIDGFTGTTGYQGFFLLPRQFGDEDPEEWDFRRVTLTGNEDAAYLLWTHDEAPWLRTTDVTVVPFEEEDREDVLEGELDDVTVGAPSAGTPLPGGSPGVDYESPGYVGVED